MNVRKRLGELLIEAGVIDQGQLQTALAHQRRWRCKLGQALVDLSMATEQQIVAALSRKLGYEIAKIDALRPTHEMEQALKLVPREVAFRHGVLPVASDASSLCVVMSDPSNVGIMDELAFRTGRRVKISVAGERELQAALQRFYGGEVERGRGAAQGGPEASPESPPPGPAGAPPAGPAVAPPAGPAAERVGRREPTAAAQALAPRKAAVLDAVQRILRGDETTLVKPAQLGAALIRVLLRQGLVTEAELVEELLKR